MQYLAICEDDLLFQFMRDKAWHGDLLKEETYRKVKLHHIDQAVVFLRQPESQDRLCKLLRSMDKALPVVLLTNDKNGKKDENDPLVRQIQLTHTFQEFWAAHLLDTLNRKKVENIRALFGEEKVHILLQHDPDPDAIGSALALRELLGRNRATTPIVTFGGVTRPENVAMIRLL